ncbi:hypothetical protein L1887_38730 [Cichorium endivia]|nr:hypothetical protein L1887_38730 [Cichorium endivia]
MKEEKHVRSEERKEKEDRIELVWFFPAVVVLAAEKSASREDRTDRNKALSANKNLEEVVRLIKSAGGGRWGRKEASGGSRRSESQRKEVLEAAGGRRWEAADVIPYIIHRVPCGDARGSSGGRAARY